MKLGFMSFFVKAVDRGAEALPGRQRVGRRQRHRLPRVLRHRRRGLDRPRPDGAGAARCGPLSFAADREGDRRLTRTQGARRARSRMEDLTGGTFTITNGGVFGSLLSTPIVNAPQSAILGMHKIQERPVVVDGQIVVRPMMYLALTYDHRIIDGREAVQFLVDRQGVPRGSGPPAARSLTSDATWQTVFDVDRHRRRARRVSGGDPRRAERAHGGLHRRLEESRRQLRLRRHLPERGLHSVQGTARILRALSPRAARVRGARHRRRRRWSSTSRPCRSARPASSRACTGGIAALFKASGRDRPAGARPAPAPGDRVEYTAADGTQARARQRST